jgi:hypothetical protein
MDSCSGLVLVIDPSSGSQESMPGFCLLKDGYLIESGHYQIPLKEAPKRLHYLDSLLREEYRNPDGSPKLSGLVIENIPPFMGRGGGPGDAGFRTKGVLNLHRSIGVVFGALGDVPITEITPRSWKSRVSKAGFAIKLRGQYGDEYDALAMAYTYLQLLERRCEVLEGKLREYTARPGARMQ